MLKSSIQIRKLQSFYNAHKNEFSIIAPAYQWAEGLLEVSFFTKWIKIGGFEYQTCS